MPAAGSALGGKDAILQFWLLSFYNETICICVFCFWILLTNTEDENSWCVYGNQYNFKWLYEQWSKC